MIRVFSFLQRNPDSGILYFRYIIPERYRQTIGKKEIKRSLRTTDRRVAIPLASKYYLITNKAQLSVHALEVLISRDAINPSMGASLQPSGLQRPVK